ncbi:MAG TPA: glycosyltransferase family 4 protein [Verrucomicrobiae bacterium]|nr:glycosyltransferase family 4 protein [Verrucomicrobiae bacterium]
MKILVVYPYLPWPLDRGTYHRTFHLLKELASAHDVSLVALAENGEGAEHAGVFARFCRSVEIISFQHPPWAKLFPQRLLDPLPSNVAHWNAPAVAARLHEIMRNGGFDAIHVCDIVMAQYFLRSRLPLIIDRSRVDLQFQLAEHSRMNFSRRARLLRYEGYTKLWLFERRLARRAALEIVCGQDDETFLRRWVKKDLPIEVLVNGVDLEYFAHYPAAGCAVRPSVIFCGAMDYNPNIDALRWYFSEMHEPLRRAIPDLEFFVVGKNPTPEILAHAQRPGVTVTGSVADVRPYYRRAWLQLVPLRIGGGTRLKIVESLAIGTPVISTTIGAQGLALEHNREILLADTTEAFVRETTRALRDAALRQQLEDAGRDVAQQRFSWERIGRRLREIYEARVGSIQVRGNEHAPAIRPPSLSLDPSGAGRR